MKVALTFLTACILLGCKDPGAKVEPATVEDVAEAAKPVESGEEPTETLAITPENSKIHFVGAKVTQSHEGGFSDFQGKVALGDPITKSQVEVTIQTASLFADEEKLTKHLKSPDFFDVVKFPTASFKSTQIEETSPGFFMSGDLTLHGQTKRVRFPLELERTDTAITANAEFSINRQDFGITYPGMPDDLIRDKVVIKLEVKLPRQGS